MNNAEIDNAFNRFSKGSHKRAYRYPLRLDEELKELLERRAKKENCSINYLINRILIDALTEDST